MAKWFWKKETAAERAMREIQANLREIDSGYAWAKMQVEVKKVSVKNLTFAADRGCYGHDSKFFIEGISQYLKEAIPHG